MFHFARKLTRLLPPDEEANISIIKYELELRQKPAIRLLHTHSNNLIAALTSYVRSEPIPRKTNTSPDTFKNLLNIHAASVDAQDHAETSAQIQSITHLAPLLHAKRPPTEPEKISHPIIPSQNSRIRTARYARHMLPPQLLARLSPPFPTGPDPSAYKYSLRQTHFYPPSTTRRESHLVYCVTIEEADRSLAGYAASYAGRKVFVEGGQEECWVRAWGVEGWGFDVLVGEGGVMVAQIRVKAREGAVVDVEEMRSFLEGLSLE